MTTDHYPAALLRRPRRRAPLRARADRRGGRDRAGRVRPRARPFRADVTDTSGAVEERAGVVPYQASVAFAFRTGADGKPDGNVKNIDVELPPGFIGNPQTLPRCSGAEWANVDGDGNPGCAAETQVGVATNTVDIGFPLPIPMPVYNLIPPPDAPAAFGFIVLGVPVTVVAKVRDADHGLTMQVPRDLRLDGAYYSSELTFWGVPATANTTPSAADALINGFVADAPSRRTIR